MADLLSTSLTGLIAFQRALAVTSHNIANANTPGYSRQIAEFSSRQGQGEGNTYIGAGTQISSIRRIYDAMLGQQIQSAASGQARFGVIHNYAGRIDQLLADPTTGLNEGLQSFFRSVQDLGNDPSSIPIRQSLISEADSIAQRFNFLGSRLGELDAEVNQNISTSVSEVNRIAADIAELNDQIAIATGGTAAQPNDLLDQRDRLLRQLSEQIGISTVAQDDGSLNVFIGSGQTLVIGSESKSLSVGGSEFDPTRLEVRYDGTAGSTALDSSLTGGSLGGLLDYRSQVLDPARQTLGQTAVAFALQINEQHANGMDLRGDLGTDFFRIDPPRVQYSGNNSGSATAAAAVSDLGALTGADYILEYDGSSYAMSRADNGQPVPMTGSGTVADPFIADGMSITVSGAAAAGDRMMIRTGFGAEQSLASNISDPQSIAAASPTRSLADLGNIGDASISAPTVADINDPALLSTTVIEFTGPATYSINGSGAFAYVDGDEITVNGSTVVISGSPQPGDRFTIEANTSASGDNSNMLALAATQSTGVLAGGSISINENYGRLVAAVGTTTRQAGAGLEAQNVVLANVEADQLASSGVNVDEEAANLIRYQQAYQAAAQVIAVASTLFDTLLGATRR